MSAETHPLAPRVLPLFVGGADGSDPLFSAIIVIVVIAVLGIGVFYLKLHAIPEQLAHKHSDTQSHLIMVRALLAPSTHRNVFWVAAGQLKPSDILIDAQQRARPGPLAVVMERLYEGGLSEVMPGSECVANT